MKIGNILGINRDKENIFQIINTDIVVVVVCILLADGNESDDEERSFSLPASGRFSDLLILLNTCGTDVGCLGGAKLMNI